MTEQVNVVLNKTVKKALFVGIDYVNSQNNRLYGCANDCNNMLTLFTDELGYTFNELRVLSDDVSKFTGKFTPNDEPTLENLRKALDWLVTDVEAGDTLIFQYSGHGSFVRATTDTEEKDHKNETLCPSDCETNGMLLDDEVTQYLQRLPSGVTLFVFTDCCHSGTNCDLGYQLTISQQSMELRKQMRQTNQVVKSPYAQPSSIGEYLAQSRVISQQRRACAGLEAPVDPQLAYQDALHYFTTVRSSPSVSQSVPMSQSVPVLSGVGPVLPSSIERRAKRAAKKHLSVISRKSKDTRSSLYSWLVQYYLEYYLQLYYNHMASFMVTQPTLQPLSSSPSNDNIPLNDVVYEFNQVRKDKIDATVVSVSGCRDDQVSLEMEGSGALTSAFIKLLKSQRNISLCELIKRLHEYMRENNLVQRPQVCASYPAQVNDIIDF